MINNTSTEYERPLAMFMGLEQNDPILAVSVVNGPEEYEDDGDDINDLFQ